PERRHRAPRCVRRGLLPLRPRPAPRATLFPYATRFRSRAAELAREGKVEALMQGSLHTDELMTAVVSSAGGLRTKRRVSHCFVRSEEHTSELQSRENLVCRLLLEKKKRARDIGGHVELQ